MRQGAAADVVVDPSSPAVVLVVDGRRSPSSDVVEVVEGRGALVVVVGRIVEVVAGGAVVAVVDGTSVTTNCRGAGSGSGRTAR